MSFRDDETTMSEDEMGFMMGEEETLDDDALLDDDGIPLDDDVDDEEEMDESFSQNKFDH
jgi:hypothetical protein